MRIGSLRIDPATVLAPLAGITNLPLRLLAKRAGCGLVYSEMVSAHGLVHGSAKTLRLLDSSAEEKPLSVQLFGADPAILARAARIVEDSGADLLDINFGCAVRKILKSNAGAALMKEPDLARRILEAVRQAVRIPLTIKIRSGWEPSGDQAVQIARVAERCGVDAVAVHPRTAPQGFRGRANWSIIARVKAALSIPVIGNGDIVAAQDALRMVAQTGCDAVMVGRAAIGNPRIFEQIEQVQRGRRPVVIGDGERLALMRTYLRDSVGYLGEETACRMLRSRLCWFAKGMPHAGWFRHSIRRIATQGEAEQRIRHYARVLRARQPPAPEGRAQVR